jgi:hypothetical protein
MRKFLISLVIGLGLAVGTRAGHNLGPVATSDYARFPVQCLDSVGFPVTPDSLHVLVWYEGEGTANGASYTTRVASGGAISSLIDSVCVGSCTHYYFVDQIQDIDNDEGQGLYVGDVVLWGEQLPTHNRFSFTLVADELNEIYDSLLAGFEAVAACLDSLRSQDNWVARQAEVANLDGWEPASDSVLVDGSSLAATEGAITDVTLDSTAVNDLADNVWANEERSLTESGSGLDSSSVARAVWNTPSANHVVAGTFGRYLDAEVSGIGGGSGAYATTLVAYDSANDQTLSGVNLAVRNLSQTSLIASVGTDSDGAAGVNLDGGSYVVNAVAPGYIFDAFDTVTIAGSQVDTISGYRFEPGEPSLPSLCRVYGYLYTTVGSAEVGATVTAYLPSGVSRFGIVVISPGPVSATTDDNGYFYLDLVPSSSLVGSPLYEIAIDRPDGTILRKRLAVPSTTTWQLTW